MLSNELEGEIDIPMTIRDQRDRKVSIFQPNLDDMSFLSNGDEDAEQSMDMLAQINMVEKGDAAGTGLMSQMDALDSSSDSSSASSSHNSTSDKNQEDSKK